MKDLWKRIKNDDLLKNIFYLQNEIDNVTFFVLFLFRSTLLYIIYYFIPHPLLFIPITFYLMYNLLDFRMRNIYKKNMLLASTLALIYTLSFFLTFSIFQLYTLRLPPEWTFSQVMGEPFYPALNVSIQIINAIHAISFLLSLSATLLFSLLKGKQNISGFTIKIKLSEILSQFIPFKGGVSRTVFLLLNFIFGIITLFLLVLQVVFLFFKHGFVLFSDVQVFFRLYFLEPAVPGLILILLIYFLLLISFISLIVRRLHDFKRNGFWVFLLYPLITLGAISGYPMIIGFTAMSIIINYFGPKEVGYYNFFLNPLVGLILNIFATLMFIILLFLFYIPGKKEIVKSKE